MKLVLGGPVAAAMVVICAFSSATWAAPSPCAAYCDQTAATYFDKCSNSKSTGLCGDQAAAFLEQCVPVCEAPLPPIEPSLAVALAEQEGTELWGYTHALDVQPVYGADGELFSYMVVLTRSAAVNDLEKVRNEAAAGVPLEKWDNSLCGVEIGARHTGLSVIGYWTGVPSEIPTLPYALEAAEKETGQSDFEVIARFRSAAMPVLELKSSNGALYYYDSMSRTGGMGFMTGSLQPKPSPEELGSLRLEWHSRLSALAATSATTKTTNPTPKSGK